MKQMGVVGVVGPFATEETKKKNIVRYSFYAVFLLSLLPLARGVFKNETNFGSQKNKKNCRLEFLLFANGYLILFPYNFITHIEIRILFIDKCSAFANIAQ